MCEAVQEESGRDSEAADSDDELRAAGQQAERERAAGSEQLESIAKAKQQFLERIKMSCTFPCSTCLRYSFALFNFAVSFSVMIRGACLFRLFYIFSVKKVANMRPTTVERVEKYLYDHPLLDLMERYMCRTCYTAAVKGKRPTLDADPNGLLRLPVIPPELQGLNRLELLLISTRILFQQVKQ